MKILAKRAMSVRRWRWLNPIVASWSGVADPVRGTLDMMKPKVVAIDPANTDSHLSLSAAPIDELYAASSISESPFD